MPSDDTLTDSGFPPYNDLSSLLVPGFLTSKVCFRGVTYNLRSLGPSDFFYLGQACDSEDWPLWATACSLWMVQGRPLLSSYPEGVPDVSDLLSGLHTPLLKILFPIVLSLSERAKVAATYLESYLYTDDSRYLWSSTGRGAESLISRAGLNGVDRLGVNYVQSSWRAWNTIEDLREEHEYQWSLTKVHLSSQSPKGVKKLEDQDKARIDAEKVRRHKIREYDRKRWEGLSDPSERPGPTDQTDRYGLKKKSWEDLSQEYKNSWDGIKDSHDLVVDKYKADLISSYNARKEAAVRVNSARKVLSRPNRTLEGYTVSEAARFRPDLFTKRVPTVVDGTEDAVYRRYFPELADMGPSPDSEPKSNIPPLTHSDTDQLLSNRKPRLP